MPTSDGRRPKRVAEGIRSVLSTLISRELSDPRLMGLVITQVDVPPDLGIAYLKVRLMIGDGDPVARKRAVQSLSRAAGRLRRALAPELKLKRVPELRFEYDTAPDDRARVEELLNEIADERSQEDPGQD